MTTAPLGGATQVAANNPLDNAFPHLLVHTRVDKLDLAAPICATESLGAVVCVSPRIARGAVANLVGRFAGRGTIPSGLMLDANRYSGKKRATGTDGMSTSWVRLQTNAGIAHPLTNAGYIPEGRIDVLRDVLRASAEMGPNVIASLALANRYLNKDVKRLIDEVNNAGVTVGVMVEHSKDPFGPRANVAGFLELLANAEVQVLLLRSDLSVIGALAWGARGGAFGTSTSLRHIYPIGKGGGPHTPSISAIVRDTLSLTRLAKIDDAIHRMPDPMWACQCAACYGRPLNWIATEDEAFQHSLSIVASIASEVRDHRLSPTQRRILWRNMCQTAQFRALELDAETGGAWGNAPSFLGSWVAQVIDDRVTI